MRGRISIKFYVIVALLLFFLISGYFFPHFNGNSIAPVTVSPFARSRSTKHLSRSLTVVFRQFEEFENDVADSVQSFVSAFPNMPILVVSKSMPYPPLPFSVTNETLRNVKVVSLELRLDGSPADVNLWTYINSDYVLFVPDSTRVSRRVLQQATSALIASGTSNNAIAIGVGGAQLSCMSVKWDYPEWTLQYAKGGNVRACDAIQGPHALLIRTSVLKLLPQPFMLPFPESLYLQTSVRKIKVCSCSSISFYTCIVRG